MSAGRAATTNAANGTPAGATAADRARGPWFAATLAHDGDTSRARCATGATTTATTSMDVGRATATGIGATSNCIGTTTATRAG